MKRTITALALATAATLTTVPAATAHDGCVIDRLEGVDHPHRARIVNYVEGLGSGHTFAYFELRNGATFEVTGLPRSVREGMRMRKIRRMCRSVNR